ncbi:MAG: hypothetical protein AJITA_00691 [Acetilactobacillus jinshanensis]
MSNQGKGDNLVAQLDGGNVIMGKTQFLPGYCILLPKRVVPSLNDLNLKQRRAYLADMSIVGDALLHCTQAYRINYEILGNTSNYLHAHIFPRYQNEPLIRKKLPVWLYSKKYWIEPKYWYQAKRDGQLKDQLSNYLKRVTK